MEKVVLVILTALSAFSFAHWWASAEFISRYGVWYLLTVTLMQLWLVGSFFQAERTIANELSNKHPVAGISKPLLVVFLVSVCVVGAFVAAHNLIVLGWQIQVFYTTLTQPYQLRDFALLVNQQDRLVGGLFSQLVWLIVVIVLFVLVSYGMLSRYRKFVAPVLLLGIVCTFLAFYMLYFWQHEVSLAIHIPDLPIDVSGLLVSSLPMAVETSFVGLGLFFACKSMAIQNLEQSFLGFAMVIAAFFSLALSFGGWLMIESTGDDISPTADKLLVLTPLYLESLPARDFTTMLWIVCTVVLTLVKTTLLAGACLYVFNRYLFPHFEEDTFFVPVLISLLACFWLIVSTVSTDNWLNATILFRDVFVHFFSYWTPLQLALLCLLAFLQPTLVHSNLMPMTFISFDACVRWYYLLLAVGCLAVFWYRSYPQVF